MVKNIFIFILLSSAVVFIVQYFLEDYIATDERQTNEQIAFKSDLTESLNNLSTLSECSSHSQSTIDITSCMRAKSDFAHNKIEKYQNVEGCFGEIAKEIVSITILINKFSDINLKISKNNIPIEEEKHEALKTLESISSRITAVSELNDRNTCVLDKIK